MLLVCTRYVKNKEEAEDVLQDSFVKLFQNIKQYTGLGSFEGWVRRIVVNTALEAIRKRKLEYAPDDIANFSNDENAEYDAISKMGFDELISLIQEMPTGCQLIFNLYVIEGFNHQEIAEKLGVTKGTSKSQLARARRIMKEKIGKYYAIKEIIQ